jgi:hypothetical protein
MSCTTKPEKKRNLVGAVRGVLAGISLQGDPLVDFLGNHTPSPLPAIATVSIQENDIGKEIILLFEDGDAARPILVGLVLSPSATPTHPQSPDVTVNGRSLNLAAQQEISLTCGQASITLTRSGKVLIKGSYVLSKSTGVNRVKGSSVELN